MSALTDYCQSQIAVCQQMIKDYPQDAWRYERLINGWQRIEKQLESKNNGVEEIQHENQIR